MDVVSFCMLPVSALSWQPRQDTHALTVVCKATFELRPGESPLAAEQQPPSEADVMVPFKETADIVLAGHVHAPHGQSVTLLAARLTVGEWNKALEAHGDRAWRVPELRGDETLILESLHPAHARLTTRLAKEVPEARVHRENQPARQVQFRCDTLCIDIDRGLATLTWRATVSLAHPAERGLVGVTTSRADMPVASIEAVKPDPIATPAARAAGGDGTGTLAMNDQMLARTGKPVLPFKPGAPDTHPGLDGSVHHPATTASVVPDAAGATLLTRPPGVPMRAVLPFAPAAHAPAPAFSDREPQPSTSGAPKPARAMNIPPPPMLGPLAGTNPVPVPESPPFLGPLAGITRAPVPVPVPVPPPRAEAEPAPVELTVEEVATIAAEIAEHPAQRAEVFEARGVPERVFRDNEHRWMTAIDEEAARGIRRLSAAYDTAYVAQVEKFRGPIVLEEYARIMAALERGRASEALNALKIHRPALMPIVRLWTAKVATDMTLAGPSMAALRAARRA